MEELEQSSLRAIKYIADNHALNIFHGDIKPANLFYDNQYMTSDSGTLLYLYHADTHRI
jgi:serine/threonine protein kinase